LGFSAAFVDVVIANPELARLGSKLRQQAMLSSDTITNPMFPQKSPKVFKCNPTLWPDLNHTEAAMFHNLVPHHKVLLQCLIISNTTVMPRHQVLHLHKALFQRPNISNTMVMLHHQVRHHQVLPRYLSMSNEATMFPHKALLHHHKVPSHLTILDLNTTSSKAVMFHRKALLHHHTPLLQRIMGHIPSPQCLHRHTLHLLLIKANGIMFLARQSLHSLSIQAAFQRWMPPTMLAKGDSKYWARCTQ
jgi:hypothetical protein